MANAISVLSGKRINIDTTKQKCTVDQNGNFALKFKVLSSDFEVGDSSDLAQKDFARAIFDFTAMNLSPDTNDCDINLTTDGARIFLNISIQLNGTKGKHSR